MRGTHYLACSIAARVGIIPAYAGNTCNGSRRLPSMRDHPRVCGEHWMPLAANCAVVGSSPRMRGTRIGDSVDEASDGIIPAYAGNTLLRISYLATIWDHPRVCGEHLKAAAKTETSKGSSPRMRGTQRRWRWSAYRAGIIPAYAGNTPAKNFLTVSLRDHPRVCGEHTVNGSMLGRSMGSSPRMRGTLLCYTQRDE